LKFLARLKKRDESSYQNEVLGLFRTDVGSFVSRDLLESLVPDYEMLPRGNHIYYSFTDMSGGGGTDSAVTVCGHHERTADGTIIVVDNLIETVPPFNRQDTAAAHTAMLREYGCMSTTGDKYAGDTYAQMFSKAQIEYNFCTQPKSELYSLALPFLSSRKVRLINNPKLIEQFCLLERRIARGSSRETIDHPQGSRFHDDCCNAVAGLIATIGDDNEFAEYCEMLNSGAHSQFALDNAVRNGRVIFPTPLSFNNH
jgi:hypothetical protein